MERLWEKIKENGDQIITILAVLVLVLAFIMFATDQDWEPVDGVFYNLPAQTADRGSMAGMAMARLGTPQPPIGDVNQDTVIDVEDAVLLEMHLRNQARLTRVQELLADVDRDGSVDHQDQAVLNDYLAGKVGRLPAAKGDVDGNGVMDYADARLLAAFLEGQADLTMDELYRADADGQGSVDEMDKQWLLNSIR